MKLENWYMVQLSQPILIGKVYGHERLPNGVEFHTNYITHIDFNEKLAYTEREVFKLGEVDSV